MEGDKISVLKKIFEKDIEAFGRFFFAHVLKLETPKFHKELYQLLERKKKEGMMLAIAAPRGHAKSTIVDLVYLMWRICNNTTRCSILLSDTYSQAVMFLETIKSEIESNERLKAFYGILKTDKWAEGEIIAGNTYVMALGAGQRIRGRNFRTNRPDLIICDDLENDEFVSNKEQREKLENWFNAALLPTLSKGGDIIAIGTILHYDSLLNKLISPDTYIRFDKRIFRAIMDGKALWPEHLNLEELEGIKKDYLSRGLGYLFYMEYMNDPITDENRKFQVEKIRWFETVDDKLTNVYMAVDRAYSTSKTADFTGIVVVAVDQENKWYVLHAERFKGEEKALIEKLFDLKSFYNPVKIGIEQKAYQYTFKPTLDSEMRKRNIFFSVEELKDLGKSKAIRIEGLLPRYESSSIFFKKNQQDLIDELTTFPKGVHDDLADALAYIEGIAEAPYVQVTNDPYYDSYGTVFRANKKR